MSDRKKRKMDDFQKNRQRSTPKNANPVEKHFQGSVRDISSDGRGVLSHPSGLTVFVEGVWLDEEGEFQLVEIKSKWATGRLSKLTVASPHRVDPFCPHHGFNTTNPASNKTPNKCGGCPWQFIDYKEQLRAKQQRIKKQIVSVSSRYKFETTILPIQPSPTLKGFRNRAQLKTDGLHIGFHSFNSNHIAAIEQCPILTPHNQETIKNLADRLPNPDWKPRKGKPHTTLHIDESICAGQVSINQRLPFQQSHSQQNNFMRDWLYKSLSKIEADLSIVELFCGSGNFTEVIASAGAKRILAVDSVHEATDILSCKELDNVEVLTINLYEENAFNNLFSARDKFTTLVLDPPRSGLQNTKALFSKKHTIKNIFYISCDLATFSRDLLFFADQGFDLEEIQPVDTTPHSPHIELLAYFRLNKRRLNSADSTSKRII